MQIKNFTLNVFVKNEGQNRQVHSEKKDANKVYLQCCHALGHVIVLHGTLRLIIPLLTLYECCSLDIE